MDEKDFEGTLILEKLAEVGLLDDFFEAIDSDDLAQVKGLMKKARIDSSTIAMVLEMIAE